MKKVYRGTVYSDRMEYHGDAWMMSRVGPNSRLLMSGGLPMLGLRKTFFISNARIQRSDCL
jgi:hypothetical protein